MQNCTHRHGSGEAPALLIYGMCGGRPMPSTLVQWLMGFIVSGGRRKALGTVSLSREVFLEGRMLHLLEAVNRRTTLVPKFAGVIDGKGHFDLCAWDEDQYRRGKKCAWKEVNTGKTDALEYVWEHRDEWSHEHEGTDEQSGEYSLACKFLLPSSSREPH